MNRNNCTKLKLCIRVLCREIESHFISFHPPNKCHFIPQYYFRELNLVTQGRGEKLFDFL